MPRRADYEPVYLYAFQHLGEARDERVQGFLASPPQGESVKKGSISQHFTFADEAYRAWKSAGWDIVSAPESLFELPSEVQSSRKFKNDACFLYAAEHFEESSETVLARFKEAHPEVESAHRYLQMGRRMLRLLRQDGWKISGPTQSSEGLGEQNTETGYYKHFNRIGTSGGAATESYVRYAQAYETTITPCHHLLQQRFQDFLQSQGTMDLCPNQNNVDLIISYRNPTSGLVLAEIKPCKSQTVRYAIRTAMGQLLDYKQREKRAKQLLIVLEVRPNDEDRALALSNNFGIAYPLNGSFEVAWPLSVQIKARSTGRINQAPESERPAAL